MAFDISTLNPEQRRAVEETEGRVLVLAGAGSGKTRVLTFRIAHLVLNLGVSPNSILGVTFTNKAAAEMRQRMAELIGSQRAKEVTLSTFHSLCMQILRKEGHRMGLTRGFTLYDEHDVTRLIKMIARDELGHEGELPSVAGTMQTISLARNRGIGPKELPSTGHKWLDEFNACAYKRLEDSMRAYNAIDFDSLLTLTVQLFEEHPDVLAAYQEQFRYIMIDEYQDTNPIQYRLANLLAGRFGNLCVVGDDDQSIYGWRGDEVRNILDFP
ncbi:MAG: UvrD-helicase domain-containing protein, partial [Chlamydiia bacterium]|nr:UvrD-helicase domain-containing protein [Chlamydiia bacterium]